MKKTITQFITAILLLIAITIDTNSQNSTSKEDVFFRMKPELAAYTPYGMSDNGRYIVCGLNAYPNKDNNVLMWDTQTDEIIQIGPYCSCEDVSDNGIVVGSKTDLNTLINKEPVVRPAYHKDGEWHFAEQHPDYGPDKITGLSWGNIYRINAEGTVMGGHVLYSKNTDAVTWNAEGKIKNVFSIGYDGVKDYQAGLRGMSEDGMAISGWTTRINGISTNGTWLACFWTQPDIDPIAADMQAAGGYLSGLNKTGTIAVGYSGSNGIILNKNGDVKKITGTRFTDLSENGIIVGDNIYSEKLGLWSIEDYMKDLYGIETDQPISHILDISANGEYICICIQSGMRYQPAFVRLSGDVLPTIPQDPISMLNKDAGTVTISWAAPRFNGYNPIGYNVFRNGIKINSEIIPAENREYKDNEPTLGKTCYTITAVYQYIDGEQNKESTHSKETCVEVISENGCFSPKQLSVNITYNKKIDLTWKPPTPNYKTKYNKDGEPQLNKIAPNMLKYVTLNQSGLNFMQTSSDGKYIYGSNTMGYITKFTIDGEKLEEFNLAGMTIVRGLTYDGEKFYTIANTRIIPAKAMTRNGADMANAITITGLEEGYQSLRVCYLPSLDEGRGGFEIGAWDLGTSNFVTKTGTVIENGGIPDIGTIKGGIMGVIEYKGKIYVARRIGDTGMHIYIHDATTLQSTGEYIDMRDYAHMNLSETDKIWGISVTTSSEGIPCLTVLAGSKLAFLELDKIEDLIGYNIYRNGVKITEQPLEVNTFSEELTEAGNYTYTVTASFNGDCESEASNPVSITINPIGTMNTPQNIHCEVIRNIAYLSWDKPESQPEASLVGYNIFRNGEKINKEYITNKFYNDRNLALGTYTYAVTAFYDNSGESEKVQTNAELKGFNEVTPPKNIELNKLNNNILLSWDTPAIGEYNTKKWFNGGIEDHIGLNEGGTFFIASKWDSEDLDNMFDYTLTDIEFFPAQNLAYTLYIYSGEDIVSTQTLNNIEAGYFNLIKLDTPVLIEKGKSLKVAFKTTHEATKNPFGADKEKCTNGKADLMSTDGITWENASTYNLNTHWAITIRLMPYKIITENKTVEINFTADTTENISLSSTPIRSADRTLLANPEIEGYKIYRNGTQIGDATITGNSFEDNQADLSINNCYRILSVYSANRISELSEEFCTYGSCNTPTLSGQFIEKGMVKLDFKAYATNHTEEITLRYDDGKNVNAIGLATTQPYYTLIQYSAADMYNLKDYQITSVSAYINSECKLNIFIKQGSRIILNQKITDEIIPGEFNTFYLDEPINIDITNSLLIGFKVTAAANSLTIGIDKNPGVDYKGDLISLDGEQLTTLKKSSQGTIDGNWNIYAELLRTVKSKETISGYNIYRNGVKINDELITDDTYTDKINVGSYIYQATTLWNTGCESETSKSFEIHYTDNVDNLISDNIKIYPNPITSGILNIEGKFQSAGLYNIAGQFIRKITENITDVSELQTGIYFLEIIDSSNKPVRNKIIIR